MFNGNVLSTGRCGTMSVWNADLHEISNHTLHPSAVNALLPFQKNLLMSGSVDRSIKFWQADF
jgi:WD40 repeat protein